VVQAEPNWCLITEDAVPAGVVSLR
jgi:hypothetical protein